MNELADRLEREQQKRKATAESDPYFGGWDGWHGQAEEALTEAIMELRSQLGLEGVHSLSNENDALRRVVEQMRDALKLCLSDFALGRIDVERARAALTASDEVLK